MKRGTAFVLGLSLAWCSPAAMALSVFDVIELTRNGYDETEIERLIELTNARFVIDVDSLLALGEANVTDEIVTLMLERGAAPPEEPSVVDQLIALREADFTEETILLFVRHRNFCEPLADEDSRRLGHAGFSTSFIRSFGDQVEDCREERESIAVVEPVPEVYEEAPAQVTRVYRTDSTVYPARSVYYPTTTYYPRYPRRYYGIYDSYYYHDRITRIYPVVVYRDYSGHKHRYRHRQASHRHGKAGHRVRDRDRRRHDRDGRRADRRGDRQEGDRDRRRRRDSDGPPRRSHPRSEPNRQLLVGEAPPDRVLPPVRPPENVRRGRQGRPADTPASTQPFVPASRPTERHARPRGVPSDVRRRVDRPEPRVRDRGIPTVRPRISAPVGQSPSQPRFRPPTRTPSVTPPSRVPSVTPPRRTPSVMPPPQTRPVASPPPAVRKPPLPVSVPENIRRRIEKTETHEK